MASNLDWRKLGVSTKIFWFRRPKDYRNVVWLEKAVQGCYELRCLYNVVGLGEVMVFLRWESSLTGVVATIIGSKFGRLW